jgi:hypothetical protein
MPAALTMVREYGHISEEALARVRRADHNDNKIADAIAHIPKEL